MPRLICNMALWTSAAHSNESTFLTSLRNLRDVLKLSLLEEHCGSVVECLTQDQGVASVEALGRVLEQDTLSSA